MKLPARDRMDAAVAGDTVRVRPAIPPTVRLARRARLTLPFPNRRK